MRKHGVPVRITGQHFTIDPILINDAIHLADIQREDLVLDIGAGRGFLTVHLARYANRVIAIENDGRLISELRSRFKFSESVTVAGMDFRRFSIPNRQFKVVSNIPFCITSDILKSLMFTHFEYFIKGCLVMQMEAAQKLVQHRYFNPYLAFYHTCFRLSLRYEIGRDSFIPPPTVKSALVAISKRKCANISVEMKEKYLRFLCFILKSPNTEMGTVLKKIFRKQQVRKLVEKYGLKLDRQVCETPAQQFSNCFNEMLNVVPNRYHPG